MPSCRRHGSGAYNVVIAATFRATPGCSISKLKGTLMAAQSKIAFITGANRGLGLETARGLGKLGITVLLGSRDLEKGKVAAAALAKDGVANVEAVHFDVENFDNHKTLADSLEKRFGRLDILVNNAGVMLEEAEFGSPGGFNTAATVSQEALRKTFEINFFALIGLTQSLLPLIKKAPAGRIVNLSSILGSLALHSDPQSPIYGAKALAYDASKTALNAFTVHLAAALKDTKIKVNSAHPGWVKTDMGGSNAMLEISEGGKTSVQLATLDDNGPTGGFFHLGQALPW
jgi:NAD(P)-dependent dehydrogenase (short-subunit alcohol dehydrogenase family)